MFSTLDCSPARFIRVCALNTWTDTPPCGGGYGPTKSTFINKSPAPQFEGDQGPQLQIHRTASIVHVDEPLEICLVEDAPLNTSSRQQQVAHERAKLAAEPLAQRNGKTALRSV